MTEISFIPLKEAVQLASCPGLTEDLLRQLAKRDKVLLFVEHPQEGLLIERDKLIQIADELRQARSDGREQYITGNAAEQQYGISRVNWYRYRNRGIVRCNDNDLLYLEDVAFVSKVAEYVKPMTGRPLFPETYNRVPVETHSS